MSARAMESGRNPITGDMMSARFGTMSLATKGRSTMRNEKQEFFRSLKLGPDAGRPTNMVHDIQGAQPQGMYKFTAKPSFYDPRDIRGTTSTKLIRDTNSVDYALKLDDIEGAQPHPYTFKTNRVVDPLLPAYQLPSTEMAPHPVPKFVRDSYNVSDIEGTAPKKLYALAQRQNQTCADVEGAQVGWRPRHERVRLEGPPRNDQFNVRDITDFGFKSNRTGCPLKPEYRIHGMVIRDDPKYATPKPLPAAAAHDFYSLKTDDIEGAAPGWVPPHACQPPLEQRRHFRNTNFVGDIAGAQADTVKHAIQTNRVVNPLSATYDSLDGDRLAPPCAPNELNGDPAQFGLSQPDAWKDAPSRGHAGSARPQAPPHPPQQSHRPEVEAVRQAATSAPASARGDAPAMSARMVSGRLDSGRVSNFGPSPVPPLAKMGAAQAAAQGATIAQLESELRQLKASGGGSGVGGSAREWQPGGGGTYAMPPAAQRLSGRPGGGGGAAAQFALSARGTARGGNSSARSVATPASRREAATLRAEISSVREL